MPKEFWRKERENLREAEQADLVRNIVRAGEEQTRKVRGRSDSAYQFWIADREELRNFDLLASSTSHSQTTLQPIWQQEADMSNVASANPEKTGDVPSAGGSSTHQLSNNTVIVVAGASGDLAKKKVSSQ